MAKKKETKSKRPSVVYRDIATGKIYTTMPKGYIRYSDLDAKGKRAADEIQNEAFPYNALSNYGSEGVVVYPNRQTLEDADTSWHLADPTETDKNMFHRANVAAEDKRVARSSNFEAALNFMSPTTYIGALFDAAQGKKSFMDSMLDGNSGIVTDKFQEEHPYLSMGANFLGDLVAGGLINKALRGALSLSKTRPINTRTVTSDVITNPSLRTIMGENVRSLKDFMVDAKNFYIKPFRNMYYKLKDTPKVGTEQDLSTILSNKSANRINTFMKEDVAPRLRRNLEDEGIKITDEIEKEINAEIPSKFTVTDPDDGTLAYVTYDGNLYIPQNNLHSQTLESTIVHEMEHMQRKKIENIVNKSREVRIRRIANNKNQPTTSTNNDRIQSELTRYSPKENEALNKAFKFRDSDILDVNNPDVTLGPTAEKGATNRELRYYIYKNTGKTGDALDNIIDNFDNNRLMDYILGASKGNGINGYMRSFLDDIKTNPNSLQNIKHSLKYVPAIISTLMGGAAIGNNIRNEQMR